jgi:multidrug efflux pump subunit AcrB
MKPPQEEKKPWVVLLPWVWFTGLFSKGLELFVRHVYRPLLGVALRWRYLTLAMGIGVIVLTVGLFGAGYVRFSFFPPIAGDQLVAMVTLPEGTPVENTGAVVGRITEALEEVRQEVEGDERGSVFKHVLVSVGTQPQVADDSWESGGGAPSGSHLGEVFVELQPPEVRGEVRPEDIMRRLRERVGPIPEAREVRYDVAINSLGKPINVEAALPEPRRPADRRRPSQGAPGDVRRHVRHRRQHDRRQARDPAVRQAGGRGAGDHPGRAGAPGARGLLRRGGAAHPARARRHQGHGALPARPPSLAGRPRRDAHPAAGRERGPVRDRRRAPRRGVGRRSSGTPRDSGACA